MKKIFILTMGHNKTSKFEDSLSCSVIELVINLKGVFVLVV